MSKNPAESVNVEHHVLNTVDRRRPDRMHNPSPELIALMRKPNAEARLKLALYDAPNFVPQARVTRPSVKRKHNFHLAVATVVCGAATAAAFELMMWVWA